MTSIGDEAFYGCSSLTNITIPNSVTTIGGGAFEGCNNLEKVILSENLEVINRMTFNRCGKLENIVIPASVKQIDSWAFTGCPSLKNVTVQTTIPPLLDEKSFSNYDIELRVPYGCEQTYAEAPVWSKFKSISDGSVFYQLAIVVKGYGAVVYNEKWVSNTTQYFEVLGGSNATISLRQVDDYLLSAATVDGEDVIDDIVDNELTIADVQSSTQVVFTFVRASTTARVKMSNDMQTYCPIEDVDFSGVEGLQAYTATGYDHGVLTVTRVLNAPAGTGLLIVGKAGTTYQVPYATSTGFYINLLQGLVEDTWLPPTQGDKTNFVLGKKDGVTTFYRLSAAGTVGAGKAYLQLPTSVANEDIAGGRTMRIVADDAITGISETLAEVSPGSACYYHLNGMRTARPQAGIYIINGRKVFVSKKGGLK